MLLTGLEAVDHVDAPQNQHPVLHFDLSRSIGAEPSFTRRYPARFQRASKRPRESPRCGRYDIIQRCGMGLGHTGRHAVVSRDRAVYPEPDRIRLRRKVGPPKRTFYSLDPNIGLVDHAVI